MFNLLQVQDRLKQLPDQELQQELRVPDPETQALVMSEVERRQRLRQGVPQGPKKSIYEQMLGMAGPPPPRFPPGGPPPGLAGMLPAQGQMGMGPGAAAPGPVPGSAGAGLMGMPGPALSPLAAMRPPGLAGGGTVGLNGGGPPPGGNLLMPVPPELNDTGSAWSDDTGFGSWGNVLAPVTNPIGNQVRSWFTPSSRTGEPLPPYGSGAGLFVPMPPVAPGSSTHISTPSTNGLTPSQLAQAAPYSGEPQSKYDGLFRQAEVKYGLPYGMLRAISWHETGGTFKPDIVGQPTPHGRALGLMQFMPETAAAYGLKPEDRADPQKSIDAAGRYVGDLYYKQTDQDTNETLRRYYGRGAVGDEAMGYINSVRGHMGMKPASLADVPGAAVPAGSSPAGFPYGMTTPPAGEANGAAPAAVPSPPDPYADAASELMKRYAALGPQKPQQITPEQWQAWQVKPNELQPAPKADYAAALDRAKQFLPNDGNYDKLQAQIDAMREASGARPLSLGEKLILIGAGMKNRWDFGGGIANEWQAEQNETQAARDRAMKLYGFQSDLSQMRERQQDAVMRLGQGMAESDQRTAAANAEAQNRAFEANRVIQENAELTNMKLSDPERSLQDLTARVGLLGQFKNMQGYNLQADIGKAVSGDSQAQARVKLYMNMIHPGESTYQQDLLYRKNRDDADRFYDQWMKEKNSPTNPDFARFQTLNEDQRREEFRKDPRAAQYLNYLGPISISSDTPGAPRRPGSP